MYRRIKQTLYPDDPEELEDIKVDKFENNLYDDKDNRDSRDANGNNNTFKNKIANIGRYIYKGLTTHLASGVSKSWFITSCLAIYTKHYVIYKLSKKNTNRLQ